MKGESAISFAFYLNAISLA